MKSIKILLALTAAALAMSAAAFADDQTLVAVPSGAVFSGDCAGVSSKSNGLQIVSKDNGHGHATILYRQ